jgi:hypothetical protein
VIGMAAQGHEDNRPAKRPNSRKHGLTALTTNAAPTHNAAKPYECITAAKQGGGIAVTKKGPYRAGRIPDRGLGLAGERASHPPLRVVAHDQAIAARVGAAGPVGRAAGDRR